VDLLKLGPSCRALLALAVFGIGLLHPADAAAQLFSPGDLARPHADLEGLKKCALCHSSDKGLSPGLCLDCHKELEARVAKHAGFHGRMPKSKLDACQSCHPDHKGRDFKMVKWDRGREAFDHARTGWPLKGRHATTRCDECHRAALIADPAIAALLRQAPQRATYLGLPTRCTACHFDEHRGQLGAACEDCHDEAAWKPVPRFDHAKTAFPLRGRHAQVKCGDCHATRTDEHARADAFGKPRAAKFLAMKPVDHESCETCHEDPHDGNFGHECASCHSEAGWKIIKTGEQKKADFHDKTRFPLRGGHVGVECRACHGPFPGQKAVFRGLPFAACSDCHFDAHLGQLAAKPPAKKPACEGCHTVNRFFPARFEREQHAQTRFPLDGGHRVAWCRGCHPLDERLRAQVPAAVRKELHARRRPERVSIAVLHPKKDPARCGACHADVHLGQLADARGADNCGQCHKPSSFSDVTFDHARTRFPLTGRHAQATCGACHKPERIGDKTAVRYRPLSGACGACHADYHLGQLQRSGPGAATPTRRDCDYCHATDTFKKTSFDHDSARYSSYPLQGKHAHVPCAGCHRPVTVALGKTVRYRPLPRRCDACHVDYHKGDFRGLSPGATAPASAGETRCEPCHVVASFSTVKFEHDRTGFRLLGAHQGVTCQACHPKDFRRRVPDTCRGCHRDVHAGQLGQRCEGCHEERSWEALFSADAHRRTNFPLVGAHALIPCTECHGNVRDRAFTRAPVECVACHQADWARTVGGTADHAALGFSTRCRDCHDVWRFAPARYTGHDHCFQISGGFHLGIRCLSCHTSTAGLRFTGACNSGTATCTGCHRHECARSDAEHARLGIGAPQGYECRDQKCQSCHPLKI
jgi:hypothetical protein